MVEGHQPAPHTHAAASNNERNSNTIICMDQHMHVLNYWNEYAYFLDICVTGEGGKYIKPPSFFTGSSQIFLSVHFTGEIDELGLRKILEIAHFLITQKDTSAPETS
jgi:hypothetical protein